MYSAVRLLHGILNTELGSRNHTTQKSAHSRPRATESRLALAPSTAPAPRPWTHEPAPATSMRFTRTRVVVATAAVRLAAVRPPDAPTRRQSRWCHSPYGSATQPPRRSARPLPRHHALAAGWGLQRLRPPLGTDLPGSAGTSGACLPGSAAATGRCSRCGSGVHTVGSANGSPPPVAPSIASTPRCSSCPAHTG